MVEARRVHPEAGSGALSLPVWEQPMLPSNICSGVLLPANRKNDDADRARKKGEKRQGSAGAHSGGHADIICVPIRAIASFSPLLLFRGGVMPPGSDHRCVQWS